jgi:hypothetical protein
LQIDTSKINTSVIVKLLNGIIYFEDPLWREMIVNRNLISDYVKPMGLELTIHEADGYGFLSQIESDDDSESIPKLVKRHPLSFEVSLLLIILREEAERFETKATEEGSLFLEKEAIRELVEVYFKNNKDEVKLLRELNGYISQVVKLGFLKPVSTEGNEVLKVMPIIKAKINIEFMEEFKRKLNAL